MPKVRWAVTYRFCSKFHMQQCKNFEDWLRLDKVTDSLKVGTFLRHSVVRQSSDIFETQCILSTQLIFSIFSKSTFPWLPVSFCLLELELLSMVLLHTTLFFTVLFFNSILKFPANNFFLFINACLPSAILHHISVPQYPSAERTLPKYMNWSTCLPSMLILTFRFPCSHYQKYMAYDQFSQVVSQIQYSVRILNCLILLH